MTAYTCYVDFTDGNDSTGDGTTSGTAWKTLQNCEDEMSGVITAGTDSLVVKVINGDSPESDQRMVFNSTAWRDTDVTIEPDTGQPDITLGPTSGETYGIRVFMGNGVSHQMPNLTLKNLICNIPATSGNLLSTLFTPSDTVTQTVTIQNCTVSYTSNGTSANVIGLSKGTTGAVTIQDSTLTNVRCLYHAVGGIGDFDCLNNTISLGTYGSPGAIVQPNNVSAGAIGSITFSGNTWSADAVGPFSILNVVPTVTGGNKTFTFSDTIDFSTLGSSTSKLVDVDDTGTAGSELTFDFSDANVKMNTTATMIRIGTSVNGAYTNSQKPRAKTATDDTNQKLRFVADDARFENVSATGAVLHIRCGVLSSAMDGTTLLCPNSDAHAFLFVANDCTFNACTFIGRDLGVLAYGDAMSLTNSYVRSERPFVAGKTGNGEDEASQGHTVTGNTLVCTSSNEDYAAFDDYGNQEDLPYDDVWYGSEAEDTDGTAVGYRDWVVTGNTFIAPNGAHGAHIGRTESTETVWTDGYFDTDAAMQAFLAGGDAQRSGNDFTGNTFLVGGSVSGATGATIQPVARGVTRNATGAY